MRPPHASAGSETQGWGDGDDTSVIEMLQGYAEESLSPDENELSRVGASIRAAFVESTAGRRALAAAGSGASGEAQRGLRRSLWNRRRVVASACAVAVLMLSSVGFAAGESSPGQPFYRLRLDIEAFGLPGAGSQDRLDADLNRAEARLDEVASKTAAADWNAAADAANAYREVIATVTLPPDMPSRASILARLDQQLARLEQFRARSREPETAALDRAIAALCAVLGIPIPTPTPAPVSSPAAGGSHRPSPAPTSSGSGEGWGRHSESPAASSPGDHDRPGDGDHDRPTPTQDGRNGGWAGPNYWPHRGR
jgi:hypothetical protein